MAQVNEVSANAVTSWVELAATGIELLAVTIIVAVIVVGTVLYLVQIFVRHADSNTYKNYRQQVARALLLGLEILVAADVIRTVALTPSLQNVLVLGLLVLIRHSLAGRLWSKLKSAGRGSPGEAEKKARRKKFERRKDSGSVEEFAFARGMVAGFISVLGFIAIISVILDG